jgi:membrane-associated phospholipid phosphatase
MSKRIILGAVLAAIVLMILGADAVIAADVAAFKFINAHHTAFLDVGLLLLTYLGNGWIVYPVFVAFLLWKIPKKKRREILAVAAVALSLSGLFNSAVKIAVNRPRPSVHFVSPGGDGEVGKGPPFRVHEVGPKFSNQSFPSGHSHTAFALATLLALIFGMRSWPAFLVATAIAYSRIYLGDHFPLDTLAGALIGTAIPLVVWNQASKIIRRE